jgi:hypothetical protein
MSIISVMYWHSAVTCRDVVAVVIVTAIVIVNNGDVIVILIVTCRDVIVIVIVTCKDVIVILIVTCKVVITSWFQESGGTVLSTNWNDIGAKKTDVKPPDGMEYKKWDEWTFRFFWLPQKESVMNKRVVKELIVIWKNYAFLH